MTILDLSGIYSRPGDRHINCLAWREGWLALLKFASLCVGWFLRLELPRELLFENFRHSRHRDGIEFEKTGNYFLDPFSAHRINIQFRLDCFGYEIFVLHGLCKGSAQYLNTILGVPGGRA